MMNRQKSSAAVSEALSPHPSDIFTFLPYACLQLCMPFTVRFVIKDEPTSDKRKGKISSLNSTSYISPGYIPGGSVQSETEVVIEAVRGPGRLSLKPRKVSRQLIMILDLAAPHCPTLTRLIITELRLFPGVLTKLSRLLEVSTISELFLDGSSSYDNNYQLLLERLTSLRLLSLDRCNIGDDVCVKLAAALHLPASDTLNILSLSTNNIGDKGVTALAQALRTNRSLYYLNLSGNPVTDVGGFHLISVLGTFPLTMEELIGMKKRYLDYLKVRNKEYQISYQMLLESAEATASRKVRTKGPKYSIVSVGSPGSRSTTGSPKRKISPPRNLKARAEALAKAKVGSFTDVFDSEQSERRGTVRYCRGNRALKSLALAYTQVTILFVAKLVEVLRSQSGGGGLVQVELAGAPLPVSSPELEEAKALLKIAQDNQIKLNSSRRKSSAY